MTKGRNPAWLPAEWEVRDVECVQALARGEAGKEEQLRALDWIINRACGAYELSYRSDADGGDRETAFAEGRRFAGMQVIKVMKLSGKVLNAKREKDGGRRNENG